MLGREGRIMETWTQKVSCGPEGKEVAGGEQVAEKQWKSNIEGQGSAAEANLGDSHGEGNIQFHREKDILVNTDGSPEGRPGRPQGRPAQPVGRPAAAGPELTEGR